MNADYPRLEPVVISSTSATIADPTSPRELPTHAALQRKVFGVLVAGQILGGNGMGTTLAAQLSGSNAWSGIAATMSTVGAAFAGFPLARLAQSRGRRLSLATGVLVASSCAVLAIVTVAADVFTSSCCSARDRPRTCRHDSPRRT